MIYPDLTPCDYSKDRFTELPTAVGWLGEDDYRRGAVEKKFVRKLIKIYQESPFREDLHYRGLHPCPYCGVDGETDSPFGIVHIGARNILIPSGETLYYSPSTIIHYITDHSYAPPDCFLQAIDNTDLSTPAFVDLVARTYKLSQSEYVSKISNLVATQNGLLGLDGLKSERWTIIEKVFGNSLGRWPPKAGITKEDSDEIAKLLGPIKEAEVKAMTALIEDNYQGTIWYNDLLECLSLYEKITAPTVTERSQIFGP